MEIIDIRANKYFGILKDFDFDNITRDTFHLLVEKDIFDVYELSNCYKSNDDYFGIELNEQKYTFGDFFLFNKKEYVLKKSIISEMINRKNWVMKAFHDLDSITNEIELLVEAEFIPEKKIDVLENRRKAYFNQIRNATFYLLFKNNVEVRSYKSWEEYVTIEFLEEDGSKYIADYLKGKIKYLPSSLEYDWNDYFIFSFINDYCDMKRSEILGIEVAIKELASKELDVSKQILLFEKLRHFDNWDDLSAHKKAKLINLLINKSEDNIRKTFSNIDKKDSELTDKFKKDNLEVENLIKSILG